VGDALGVPVEFRSREEIANDPVKDIREFGTHRQPKGTWSDDGALILCTVESLLNAEFDTQDMGNRFVRWMNDTLWTATGVVFDAGSTTADALIQVANGIPAEEAGGRAEYSNGNGSLMRIIPVALRFASIPAGVLAERAERASAITHGHRRSRMSCAFYSLFVGELLLGKEPQVALSCARADFARLYEGAPEFERFRHHLTDDFRAIPEPEIVSTGYVLRTLHAALWCLLNSQSYRDCVLKAVNLGGDTDTTGCVAGGLAGVAYGVQAVPAEWTKQLARKDDVERLFAKFADLSSKPPNDRD
jgi:ADP-ribosylglycohydrolase